MATQTSTSPAMDTTCAAPTVAPLDTPTSSMSVDSTVVAAAVTIPSTPPKKVPVEESEAPGQPSPTAADLSKMAMLWKTSCDFVKNLTPTRPQAATTTSPITKEPQEVTPVTFTAEAFATLPVVDEQQETVIPQPMDEDSVVQEEEVQKENVDVPTPTPEAQVPSGKENVDVQSPTKPTDKLPAKTVQPPVKITKGNPLHPTNRDNVRKNKPAPALVRKAAGGVPKPKGRPTPLPRVARLAHPTTTTNEKPTAPKPPPATTRRVPRGVTPAPPRPVGAGAPPRSVSRVPNAARSTASSRAMTLPHKGATLTGVKRPRDVSAGQTSGAPPTKRRSALTTTTTTTTTTPAAPKVE